MIDRFRPRRGMFQDIRSRPGGDAISERLEKAHLRKDYAGLEALIRKRCSETGLRCVDAF
jgi:hypothetical protein